MQVISYITKTGASEKDRRERKKNRARKKHIETDGHKANDGQAVSFNTKTEEKEIDRCTVQSEMREINRERKKYVETDGQRVKGAGCFVQHYL